MKASVVRTCVALIFSFGLICTIHAQGLQENKTVTTIGQYHLELSDKKTTNIIFPYAVKSVDRGSGDIIAQLVQGFGNVLQLKANVQDFKQTNVTVITSDGKFYSFIVDYNSDPKVLNLSFNKGGDESGNKSVAIPDDYSTQLLDSDAGAVLNAKSFLHKHITNEKIKLRLAAIFLKNNLMWFKLSIHNRSQINYDLDHISFSVIDKAQVKRTAQQEIWLQPVYTKSVNAIQGNTSKAIVLAFKPFTLVNTKRLKIQISEKEGGRNLMMVLNANKLLRAKAL